METYTFTLIVRDTIPFTKKLLLRETNASALLWLHFKGWFYFFATHLSALSLSQEQITPSALTLLPRESSTCSNVVIFAHLCTPSILPVRRTGCAVENGRWVTTLSRSSFDRKWQLIQNLFHLHVTKMYSAMSKLLLFINLHGFTQTLRFF